jgi:hypothetical protein
MAMAQLLGALVGIFLISRLFWVVTRAWPNSLGKAVFLNVICAAIVIPLDYLLRDDVSFIEELALYGACQAAVLIFDLFRVRKNLPTVY